jgi:hypothetical protein
LIFCILNGEESEALKLGDMKISLNILLLILWAHAFNCLGQDSFSLIPVAEFGYEKSVGKTKKEGSVKVLKTLRDSEGEAYVLFHTIGTFPVIGARPHRIWQVFFKMIIFLPLPILIVRAIRCGLLV